MSKSKADIAKQLQELEEIVAWFESGQVDVAEAVAKYEQGLKLIAKVQAQLKDAELKIAKISKRFDA